MTSDVSRCPGLADQPLVLNPSLVINIFENNGYLYDLIGAMEGESNGKGFPYSLGGMVLRRKAADYPI